MIVDIISDIHIDFYFKKGSVSREGVKELFMPFFSHNGKRELGDVLVIAGDLGHFNQQNIEFLQILNRYYYKDIICVLGNHDYYLMPHKENLLFDDAFQRVDHIKQSIAKEEHIHLLDGDVVEIDGVRFGGAMGWYSRAYLIEYFSHKNYHTRDKSKLLWRATINDAHYIKGLDHFLDLYDSEYKKLEDTHKKCDIMVTHVNPSYKVEHLPKSRKTLDTTNTFFTFDGHKLLKNGTMKYWVFGHTHESFEYSFAGVECICNAFGYPQERDYLANNYVKSIEFS
jgi:metallophosphoesterase superfamily enzyme